MKMKSKSTMPREYVAKKATKPGNLAKAMAADKKMDAKVAKKYGVKAR